MRLLDPGAGELTDRLTILALKILFGDQAGKDTTHFKAERTSLLTKVRSKTLNGVWFDKMLDLAAVNAALWHKEDDLRVLREEIRAMEAGSQNSSWLSEMAHAGQIAFQIQSLNDRRAQLVAEINKDAGDAGGQEKI
jgi:hypothetical protein